MELTKKGKEELQKVEKDWGKDPEAQEANRRYLKNIELLRRIEEMKYRYDVLEGEIRAIEFKKHMLPSKIKCHVLILMLFLLFAFMMAKSFFSMFLVPFYIIGLIMEIIKIIKDFLPHIINLSVLRRFQIVQDYQPFDLLIHEKQIALRELREQIAELESQVEKRPDKGEDMIS